MATNLGSRKRPAPPSSSTATTNPPPPSSSPLLRIDTLLAKYARNLPPGGTISIQLIKGPTSSSVDPIAIRKVAAKKERQLQRAQQQQQQQNSGFSSGMSSGNDDSDGGGGGAARQPSSSSTSAATAAAAEKLTLSFPRIAKFPETVSKPNFYTMGGGSSGGSSGSGGGLRDGRMYEEEVPLVKVRYIYYI